MAFQNIHVKKKKRDRVIGEGTRLEKCVSSQRERLQKYRAKAKEIAAQGFHQAYVHNQIRKSVG